MHIENNVVEVSRGTIIDAGNQEKNQWCMYMHEGARRKQSMVAGGCWYLTDLMARCNGAQRRASLMFTVVSALSTSTLRQRALSLDTA